MTTTPGLTEQACEVMHDAYEAAAGNAGWETQERSRKPWADVPEANKATMRAAVTALLDFLADRATSTGQDDRVRKAVGVLILDLNADADTLVPNWHLADRLRAVLDAAPASTDNQER